MESVKLICVVCPQGCHLEGLREGNSLIIKGGCKRGKEYAYKEITAPCRLVTTTVPIRGGAIKRLPVRTSGPFPKGKIKELMIFLKSLEVQAPIRRGAVVVEDVLGEKGIHLLAARTVARDGKSSGNG
ncbi:MAG: DUF1667 domain-containing protein [Atribacterota bacterium]|nr:DUF1667 domain-containing protein [Atribacterota bacterium]